MTRNITLVFSVVIHAFLWTVNKLTKTIQHWTIFPVIKILFHYKLHLSTFQMKKWKTNISSTLYSLFGRILAGRFDNPTSVNLHNSVYVLRIYTETISENIFNDKLDSCTKNVFSCYQEREKLENNKVYIGFKDNRLFEDGYYSTKLPVKKFYDVVPGNYQVALKRFNFLKERLTHFEPMFHLYTPWKIRKP